MLAKLHPSLGSMPTFQHLPDASVYRSLARRTAAQHSDQYCEPKQALILYRQKYLQRAQILTHGKIQKKCWLLTQNFFSLTVLPSNPAQKALFQTVSTRMCPPIVLFMALTYQRNSCVSISSSFSLGSSRGQRLGRTHSWSPAQFWAWEKTAEGREAGGKEGGEEGTGR